ncbi:MAG: F0F1 ATP synthase subunit gamma [Anaerolineae bacterium]|nr:F0F1 ATP synthase subunit gamma [Anaerolineae bacterium]
MTYELKKAERRLTNIQKVKPILAALRTISLGSWQTARNRRSGLGAYTERLLGLLPLLLPHMLGSGSSRRAVRLRRRSKKEATPQLSGHVVTLVIGSERGLCGQYNKVILAEVTRYFERRKGESPETVAPGPRVMGDVEIVALGSRLIRELTQAGTTLTWGRALSMTSLPTYELAHELAVGWLARYEAYELDGVDVVYNADAGAGTYSSTTVRLIPPELPAVPVGTPEDVGAPEDGGTPGDVIVETDPMRLYVRVVEQWTAIALYRLLLGAAVTEHSARYQLMESATQNADDLVDELMLTVKSARRQAITREMQELAVSAGLLGE